MKYSVLTLLFILTTIGTILAQDTTTSKNKLGITLSTNIFGFDDEPNKVALGGGFYFNRNIAPKFSIYSELTGSNRNYGDLAIRPGLSGGLTTSNLAIYIAPMFEIGKKSNLSVGIVQNYLISSNLKTSTSTIDIGTDTKNYSSILIDFRYQISNKISLGTRYEWGLNSMFKSIDRKVTSISFATFIKFGSKVNQRK